MEPGDPPPTDDEDEREDRDPGTENADATDAVVSDADDDAPSAEPGTTAADREANENAAAKAEPGDRIDDPDPLSAFLHAKSGPLMWAREFLSSAAIVLVVGLLLFGVSGVWPPMVAVESGSMEPHMEKGDLIVVTEPGRFAPDAASGNGIVTHEKGQSADYQTFGGYGSVVVFDDPSSGGSPIIHRAHLRVEEGENWYDRGAEEYMAADSCDELRNCPAPADGYITKGDNNARYDQAQGIAPVVREDWVTGVARLRVPYLGWIRLIATGQATLFGGTAFSGAAFPGTAFPGVAGVGSGVGAGVGAGLIGAGAVATRRRA